MASTAMRRQGLPGEVCCSSASFGIPIVRIAMTQLLASGDGVPSMTPVPISSLVGRFSFGAYTLLRCGVIGIMRYELLSVLGATGSGRLVSARRARSTDRRCVDGVDARLVCWDGCRTRAAVGGVPRPPADRRRSDGDQPTRSGGVRYAYADYWLAYYITFLTNERIIVHSTEASRIAEYKRIVDAHKQEAVLISRTPARGDVKCSGASTFAHRSAATSQPPFTPVPLERSPDALSQSDRGRIAQLGASATDVECAALGEEVDSTAVDRRLDPERSADRSHAAPAIQNGHTGTCHRGVGTLASSAMSSVKLFSVVTSPPARM